MKSLSILLCVLVSLLLIVNFCYAAEENVAEIQPGQGADVTKNGEEEQEEKFKYFHHHKPYYKKPFYKKPYYKPVPHKIPIVKKPIPHHPIFKKPYLKPHYPPVFPSHP